MSNQVPHLPSQAKPPINWQTVGLLTIFLLTLGGIGQVLYFGPQLPANVASHFDAQGNANGFMPRQAFIIFDLCLLVGNALIFLLILWAIRKLPPSLINIPNREYWLADERRAETVRWVGAVTAWIGVASQVFFIALFQMTISANLKGQGLDGLALPILIGIFLFVITAACLAILLKFRKIPADSENSIEPTRPS